MARSDIRYRQAFNLLLDYCGTLPVGALAPAEKELGELAHVSRTVIRRCLGRLKELEIISWEGREKRILRKPKVEDRIEPTDPRGSSDDLERKFLEWVLKFDVPAGTPLAVAELSRTFNVPQHEIREFLASLSRFGLVARRSRGGWMLRGFTREFAIELSDFRSVLELNALSQVVETPDGHPVWDRLAKVRAAHLDLKKRIDTDYHEFSRLDEAFHQTVNSAVRNRFVEEFQKIISLVFHYHYLWDKSDEKVRNAAAIDEHLAIIDALEARDAEGAIAAARRHLTTSKTTLLSSLRHHDFI